MHVLAKIEALLPQGRQSMCAGWSGQCEQRDEIGGITQQGASYRPLSAAAQALMPRLFVCRMPATRKDSGFCNQSGLTVLQQRIALP